jgi:putative phosphotransacetylase
MTVADAKNFGVENGQIVKVRTNWERGIVFDNVVIRVSDSFALDTHIDIEEANAAALKQWDRWELILD